MKNAIYHDILYRLGKPQLTDTEYDKKFGIDIVFHNRVKSFLKSKDKNKILDYINKFFKNKYITEPKLDGINISLLYNKRGKLEDCLSKNSGKITGIDVTQKVLSCCALHSPIPKFLNKNFVDQTNELQGELILKKEDKNEYKTARDRLAACINSDAQDNSVNAYFFVHTFCNSFNYSYLSYLAQKSGFLTMQSEFLSKNINRFDADGILFKCSDKFLAEGLGETETKRKWMCALKF